MSLKERIEADMKKAMLDKDKDSLRALRAIKSLILIAETEKGKGGELTADKELTMLMKAYNQRKESAEIYAQQGREDLRATELTEMEVISRYMPEQLSGGELKEKVKAIVEKTGATSMADMGKVMGVASKELAGKADGKAISAVVKELLS